MVDTVKRLNANDCFDYFVNNFESLYRNQSTYRHNPTIDPEMNNNDLYVNLTEHFSDFIVDQADFNDFEVHFARDSEGVGDFIVATFVDKETESEISIEINRGESPESIENSFRTGHQSLLDTFASEVYEIKSSNHQ